MNGVLVHGLDYDDTHSAAASSTRRCRAFPWRWRSPTDEERAVAIFSPRTSRRWRRRREWARSPKAVSIRSDFIRRDSSAYSAATLAASRLLGLGREQAVMAQGIALSMAGGSLEFLEDGAWTKRTASGLGGVERDHRGDARQAWLHWAARGL